ncbi:MAG: hypothetical protein AAGG72_04215 [Pseudomonadota bacterium]
MKRTRRQPKRTHRALTLATLTSTLFLASMAQAKTPANVDDCLEGALATADKAQSAGLSADKMADVENLLQKLESQCDTNKLQEAGATMKQLEAKIAEG